MPKEEEKAEEPRLTWQSNCCRWWAESADGLTFAWISDAAFRRYLTSELIARGLINPSMEQSKEVFLAVEKLSFWLEREADPDVHVRRFGRAYLEHQRKQQEEDRHAR